MAARVVRSRVGDDARESVFRQFPDELVTENRGVVRVSQLHPDTRLKVAGRMIKASDILLSSFVLACGDEGQGIEVGVGDMIFCDQCQREVRVSRSTKFRASVRR